ncbi:benenodin family lasso peptide [Hyphococcus luteus]|nr:benenodin family lasso peptide [Marinicaulis flavus]
MKQIETHEDDIIDLGVASEVTKGIPSHVTQEAFLQRQPVDELSAD